MERPSNPAKFTLKRCKYKTVPLKMNKPAELHKENQESSQHNHYGAYGNLHRNPFMEKDNAG